MDNSRDLSLLQPVPHSTACMQKLYTYMLLGCEPKNHRAPDPALHTAQTHTYYKYIWSKTFKTLD